MDFNLYLVNSIKIVIVFSNSLLYYNTLVNNIQDNYNNYYNIDILLLSLLDNILEVIP